jgi:hypothetical protein
VLTGHDDLKPVVLFAEEVLRGYHNVVKVEEGGP